MALPPLLATGLGVERTARGASGDRCQPTQPLCVLCLKPNVSCCWFGQKSCYMSFTVSISPAMSYCVCVWVGVWLCGWVGFGCLPSRSSGPNPLCRLMVLCYLKPQLSLCRQPGEIGRLPIKSISTTVARLVYCHTGASSCLCGTRLLGAVLFASDSSSHGCTGL